MDDGFRAKNLMIMKFTFIDSTMMIIIMMMFSWASRILFYSFDSSILDSMFVC